jgi:WS/DGAT C-terminal domain
MRSVRVRRISVQQSTLIAELPTNLHDPVEPFEPRMSDEGGQGGAQRHWRRCVGRSWSLHDARIAGPRQSRHRSTDAPTSDAPIQSNISVSNPPGPRVPLHLAGHRLQAHYAVAKVDENKALMITVASYLDNVDVGLVADPEVVPDLWAFLGMLTDALQELSIAVSTGR